jgi:hypothetical protein
MVARVLAGACGVALAAMFGSGAVQHAALPERPVVLRMSVPLPVAGERGYASFSMHIGGRDVRFAATWSGGEEHRRLAVVLASEGED